MTDFRIVIDINGVTLGDVTDVAQTIYETFGPELDAQQGDFKIRIQSVNVSGRAFDTVWEPES